MKILILILILFPVLFILRFNYKKNNFISEIPKIIIYNFNNNYYIFSNDKLIPIKYSEIKKFNSKIQIIHIENIKKKKIIPNYQSKCNNQKSKIDYKRLNCIYECNMNNNDFCLNKCYNNNYFDWDKCYNLNINFK